MSLSNSHSEQSLDPQDLLHKVQQGKVQGDDGEFGQLLQVYRNYLRLLAESQLDHKLRARVSPSDLVQETMLDAHRDFANFRGSSEREFLAWLRKILVNNLARIIELHVMAGKRDIRRDISLDGIRASLDKSTIQLGQVFAGREETPSANLQRHERAVVLADLMSRLSGPHREVLVLRNLQGLRFHEVAERMERSVPATKMLWMRAIKQLRKLFDAEIN